MPKLELEVFELIGTDACIGGRLMDSQLGKLQRFGNPLKPAIKTKELGGPVKTKANNE